MLKNLANHASCTCFAIVSVERKVITRVKMNFTISGEVKKKMSQVHLEQPNFPWIILVLATISGGLLYKIGLWVYEYGLWIWNNRGGSERSRKSKKHHSSKKKKTRSPSPDSSSSSDSDSSD